MNAAQFHEHFERAFTAAVGQDPLRRLKGKQLKWKSPAPQGILTLGFSTNSRVAKALVAEAVRLQKSAIGKYLVNRYDNAADRAQWIETHDPFFEPRPNIEQWFYYFDSDDAEAWGRYFGGSMAGWIRRFNDRPESMEDWCQRLLVLTRSRAGTRVS